MTWGFVSHRGSANNKVSGTTISVSPSAQINAGAILVVRGVADNTGTTSGESTEHSCADSKGNSYTKVKEWRYSAGAAADGVVHSLFISRLTYTLLTSDTVTLTLGTARIAKAVGLAQFSITGTGITVQGANGNAQANTTAPTVTLSSLTSQEYLWLGCVGIEGPNGDTFTQDTDYGNNTSFGTTGSTATGNVASRLGSRIYTGTSDTYNPTLGTARDCVAILGAILETQPVAKSFADSSGGIDAFVNPYRAMPFAETGHGAESFVNPYRGMGFAEAGHGAENFNTAFRSMGFTDVGSGTDIFQLFALLNFSDTGHGTDIFQKIVTLLNKYFSDSSIAVDSFAVLLRLLGFSDVGGGIESFSTPFRECCGRRDTLSR